VEDESENHSGNIEIDRPEEIESQSAEDESSQASSEEE